MPSYTQRFWCVSGANDGVGKSLLTAFLGVSLARAGKSVILVDAGRSASNLEDYLGVKNRRPMLQDYLADAASIEDVIIQTEEPGLRAICSAGALVGIADSSVGQKEKIIRFIGAMNAEYILVDLGAGILPNLLDFFNMSDEGIVVVNPDPTAMHNAYEFVRSAIYRLIQRKFSANLAVIAALRELSDNRQNPKPRTMIEFFDHLCVSDAAAAERIAVLVDRYRPHIVVNMATSEQDQRVAELIQSACKKFLNVDLKIGGIVLADPAFRDPTGRLFRIESEVSDATAPQQIREVMLRLLNSRGPEEMPEHAGSEKGVSAAPIMGFNDNLIFKGSELHVQTEDMGQSVRCITTQVFMDGRIILTTKLDYPAELMDRSDRSQVMELMRRQHFDLIRDIKSGRVQPPLYSRQSE